MSAKTPRHLSHDQYSVGIICPLGDELAVVEAMLDQIDTTLPTVIPDYAYTLGSVGNHNVVVAVLPNSGETSAAWTGANLLRNFPSIRFGLLVGIGGGVPGDDEEHDVRLGDVVVSYANGKFGGVVQYTSGKVETGWTFERTGSIDSPPRGLMAQVNKLRARHIREGSQISTYLDVMLRRYPRMVSYTRPTSSPDKLFLASYAHASKHRNCSDCDTRALIPRTERPNDDPVVFYGIIGSGDIVVRNAELRDLLKEEYGILCVDMEAAGLMHDFPCLVIRGISDYADSHKNDTFKRYAAATAAAYMKELLLIMPSHDLHHIPTAPKSLQDGTTPVTSTLPTVPEHPEIMKHPLGPLSHTSLHAESGISSSLPIRNQPRDMNILLLGEIGVGKSTFINAAINYIKHDSLEEALRCDDLDWVIPCSFVTQTVDETKDSKIVETKIKVGSRENESDGSKGHAAAVRTFVYPVVVGSTTYRLIEAPGIGDPRGLEFDKANMHDVMDTLRGYDHLHGILILLKTNTVHLKTHFAFCIKELLTFLHRDAIKNVAFGFVNTRVSNYLPGDAYGALKSLLSELPEIGISLERSSVYCFDSEGFRYLAAAHSGLLLSDKSGYSRSWQKSSAEMYRFFTCYGGKKAHVVKKISTLYGTRALILEMIKPMDAISLLINNSLEVLSEEDKELRQWKLTREETENKLITKKVLLRSESLKSPRIVCTDTGCIQLVDDGTGGGYMVTTYPHPCQNECYLDDISMDIVGHPDFLKCEIFSGKEHCSKCGHHWQVHSYIMHQTVAYQTTIVDQDIKNKLEQIKSDIQLKETVIHSRNAQIKEYKAELATIQLAAAKFRLFVKQNSILPYNDATIDYLNMLIMAERTKIEAGGGRRSQRFLENLSASRDEHMKQVTKLESGIKVSDSSKSINEEDITCIKRDLLSLKHFGSYFNEIPSQTAGRNPNWRERPFRVK